MNMSFSVLTLGNNTRRWEGIAEQVRQLPGRYIYFAYPQESPDPVRIRKMFAGVSSSADLIVPVPHTEFPADEALEEPLLLPQAELFARFRCNPMLNGKLIRKNLLLKCLESNTNDWIHSPCPDLFLLLFYPGKTAFSRTEYNCDRETFRWIAKQYRQAAVWLDGLKSLNREEKLSLQGRILQYEDYLIDQAFELNLEEEIDEFFDRPSIIYNCYTRHPKHLLMKQLPKRDFPPGPIRHLAVFVAGLRGGGAERCASLLLKHFSEMPDLKICLIQNSPRKPTDYPCPESVEIIVLPKGFYSRQAQLLPVLREKKIDTCIFFDHYLSDSFFDILGAMQLGIRTIGMERNNFSYPCFLGEFDLLQLRQTVYSGVDLLTCLSRADEYLWNQQGIRTRYLPSPLTFGFSSKLFTEKKEKNMVFIGRMVPGKGVQDVLKATALIRRKHPEAKLFMLGAFSDPVFEQEIRELTEDLQLNGNVEFTGFTKVENYICRSAVHLMPSNVEGYPMTLMEVKSYGVPTVAYSLPYLEAGKEEYGTLMVPQQDYRAMAEKVSELFSDFDQLNQLGRRAWESLQFFNNDVAFTRWRHIFEWFATGQEPAGLAVPDFPVEKQLELLKIETHEIISGMVSMAATPFCRNIIINEKMNRKRHENILFGFVMKMYFALHKRMEKRSFTAGCLGMFFRSLWRLKRIYRFFKPWKDEEQRI